MKHLIDPIKHKLGSKLKLQSSVKSSDFKRNELVEVVEVSSIPAQFRSEMENQEKCLSSLDNCNKFGLRYMGEIWINLYDYDPYN